MKKKFSPGQPTELSKAGLRPMKVAVSRMMTSSVRGYGGRTDQTEGFRIARTYPLATTAMAYWEIGLARIPFILSATSMPDPDPDKPLRAHEF